MPIRRFNKPSSKTSAFTQSTIQKVKATGGVIEDIGGYKIHTFNDYITTNSFVVTQSGSVEILVVAGGGAGSVDHGGGGGAGGLLYSSSYSVTPGSYSVTIGQGGRAIVGSYLGVYSQGYTQSGGTTGRPYGNAANGSNSVFASATAIGGGGGGGFATSVTTAPGGSGGGSGAASTLVGGLAQQGSSGGLTGYGYPGGSNAGSTPDAGGGGGGAGEAGFNGRSGGTTPGKGGNGLAYSISGTSRYYAQGGMGGSHQIGATYGGNFGGGGRADGGQNDLGTRQGHGTPGTGGGGAGRSNDGLMAGHGGSGIVIVRYIA